MSPPVELLIGLRYVRAKRRNHFIGFISIVSMLGIAIGVMALIVVLSVMNGFEKELRERILGMASHATISGERGLLADWQRIAEQATGDARVVAAAPYISGEAMLRVRGQTSGTLLRGVLPEREAQVSKLPEYMRDGGLEALQPGGFGVLLGAELARSLGVAKGDSVDLMVPQASVTPAGALPRFRRFEVVGVFEVGMYEFDRGLGVIHLDDAQALLRMSDQVSGVRLMLEDLFQAPRVVRDVAEGLGGRYRISDWTREHANFFRAIRTEKTVMFIILSLIVGVAAFNIVSTLVMVVQDKQPDIAILRTIGATPRMIMLIFLVQGLLIGVIGTLLGLSAGLALALNIDVVVPFIEALTGQQFLAPDVYYISDLPSEVERGDLIRVGGMAFLLALFSGLYPAWRAARTLPAEALRHE